MINVIALLSIFPSKTTETTTMSQIMNKIVCGRPVVAGNDGRTDTSELCYNFQVVGYMSHTCPEEYRQ